MRQLRALIVLLAMCFMSVAAMAEEQTGAGKVVAGLHQSLLDAMKRSGELGYKGRYDLLQPVVSESFDFPTIARIVTGKHWAGLKPEQQQNFIDVFTRLSTATYASRFDSYSGESFRSTAEEKQSENKVLVKTELVRSDGSTVKLHYLVQRDKNAKWRILNVIVDGVSDLSLKRSEYSSIINSEGFSALMDKLNGKISQYETPARAQPGS